MALVGIPIRLLHEAESHNHYSNKKIQKYIVECY